MTSEWTYNFDLDFNECVHFVSALGWYFQRLTLERPRLLHINTRSPLQIHFRRFQLNKRKEIDRYNEQPSKLSGWSCLRAMIDSFTISVLIESWNLEVAIKAHWVLQKEVWLLTTWFRVSLWLLIRLNDLSQPSTRSIFMIDYHSQNKRQSLHCHWLQIQSQSQRFRTLIKSQRNAKVELVPQSPTYAVGAKVASFVHADSNSGQIWRFSGFSAFENVEPKFSYSNELEEIRKFEKFAFSYRAKVSEGKFQIYKIFHKRFQIVTDTLTKRKGWNHYDFKRWKRCTNQETTNRNSQSKIEISDCGIKTTKCQQEWARLYACSIETECFYDTTDGRRFAS